MQHKIATIGDNNPPEPTPFEAISDEINDAYDLVTNTCTGAELTTQEQANSVKDQLDDIRKLEAKAKKLMADERKPHNDELTKISDRFNPLIGDTTKIKGKTVTAKAALQKLLTPWQIKLQREADEAAARAREAAAKIAAEAQAAREAAQASTDMEAAEEAEALAQQAIQAERDANRAAKVKPKTGSGRAAFIRTTYIATVTDPIAFGKYCWEHHKPEYLEFLQNKAQSLVNAKQRSIPGVEISEKQGAV